MFESLTQRRYLLPFRAARLPQQVADVLVIGGGVAGLRAAIAAAEGGADVLLLTKDTVEQSNTWYAQGGIAAVLQPLDSVESHIRDTEIVGVGLCDEQAVRVVVEEGPQRVLELLSWGARFDKKAGNPHDLAFGLEGGHSYARILHAYGDATGKELAQTLINKVRSYETIRISERTFAIDLITDPPAEKNGKSPRCIGALALIDGHINVIWARHTILASGGAGQLYRESTNPKIATADGHAMAYRAGAAPDDALRRRLQPRPHHRSRARRRRLPDRQEQPPLHARLSPPGRAGTARCGEPGDRRADSQNQLHPRLSRCAASADGKLPRALPSAGVAV
jgi:L-aspartate oxidase